SFTRAQVRDKSLLHGAAVFSEQECGNGGGNHWQRRDGSAYFFDDQAHIADRQSKAVDLFGQRCIQPAKLKHLTPELLRKAPFQFMTSGYNRRTSVLQKYTCTILDLAFIIVKQSMHDSLRSIRTFGAAWHAKALSCNLVAHYVNAAVVYGGLESTQKIMREDACFDCFLGGTEKLSRCAK